MNKPAPKGHVYVCGTCACRRELLGALIKHARAAHSRSLSAPEYQPITDRQAAQFALHVRRQAERRS